MIIHPKLTYIAPQTAGRKASEPAMYRPGIDVCGVVVHLAF